MSIVLTLQRAANGARILETVRNDANDDEFRIPPATGSAGMKDVS